MIKTKEKPCKGTTAETKSFGCGQLSDKRTYGLCPKCKYSWATETLEGKEWFDRNTKSLKEKKVKIEKTEFRKEKTLSIDWSKKLQIEVNSIVRLIDNGLTCLARNQRGQIHAGHVYARGGNQSIRYNLHNIHRQSAQSNHHQNDDGLLREGLISEYGNDYMTFISELRRTPALKFSNVEYRSITEKARIIVKELKEKDKLYSKHERIELRTRINFQLKIYDKTYCEFNIN